MLLDVSVKMEIIDFLQPRIKQELPENIIITPKKCVKGIMFILDFARMILGACFGLGPSRIGLNKVIETKIRGSFWNLTFLEHIKYEHAYLGPGVAFSCHKIQITSSLENFY